MTASDECMPYVQESLMWNCRPNYPLWRAPRWDLNATSGDIQPLKWSGTTVSFASSIEIFPFSPMPYFLFLRGVLDELGRLINGMRNVQWRQKNAIKGIGVRAKKKIQWCVLCNVPSNVELQNLSFLVTIVLAFVRSQRLLDLNASYALLHTAYTVFRILNGHHGAHSHKMSV